MIKAKAVACMMLAGAVAGCSRPQPVAGPSGAPLASATSAVPGAAPAAPGDLAAYQAKRRASIMRADTDHDGRISEQEWIAWRTAHPGKGSDPVKQFEKYDANHDGFVTPDEIDSISARLYARRTAMQAANPGQGSGGAE